MSQLQLIPAERLKELPPTENLHNTRLIARGFNVVFGPSGSYKSFYTMDAALTIAQAAPVVYVAAEGAGGLHRRVEAWREYHGTSTGQLYFICQEVNLRDALTVSSLVEAVQPLAPTLIVFDTLARCIPGGDENSAKDMGVAIQNSAVIQRRLNCAVTWVHHSNRAERGERGSGAVRGAADAMIELISSGDDVVRVVCSKSKDEEPWATEELKFQAVGASGLLIPAENIPPSQRLTAHESDVLEILGLSVFATSGAQSRQIVAATGITERHVYRILSRLKELEAIMQDTKGDPYRITESGRLLLYRMRPAKPFSPTNVVNIAEARL